ncbi:MAG TPA: hypothetical protein VIC62_17795, partial [Nakamurella sp.]
RWRRVVARQHEGTINLRYLAPPLAVVALALGTIGGIAGLVALSAGATGWWPWLLTAGLAAPLGYLVFALWATMQAAARGGLRGAAVAALPVVLTTMHVSWGAGFLTSPRRLLPGRARSRPV